MDNNILRKRLDKFLADTATVPEGGSTEINNEIKAYIKDFEELQDMVSELDTKLTEKVLLLEQKEAELSELARRKEEIEASYDDYIIKTVSHIIGIEAREQSMKASFLKRESLIRTKLEELRQRETRLKEIEEALEKEKEKLEALGKKLQNNTIGDTNDEIKELLEEKDREIKELKERLKSAGQGTVPIPKDASEKEVRAIELLREKEIQMKEMQERYRKKEKELAEFQKKLKEYENVLEEREKELALREEEIANSEAPGGLNMDDVDVKLQIEHEIKKRELLLKKKYDEELQAKLKTYKRKIEALQKRNDDLESAADMLEESDLKLKALEKALREREEELAYLEEKIKKKEEKLLEERRRFEEEKRKMQAKLKNTNLDKIKLVIEQKNQELVELEERLREREEFLRRKEKTILNRQNEMIEREVSAEISVDKSRYANRVSTGIGRLDELFYGGIPKKSHLLITGSKFTGEEQFLRLFVCHGMRSEIPSVYITTDNDTAEIRAELKRIVPGVEGFEQEGLIRYIDAYSANLDMPMDDKYTRYIKDRSDLDEVSKVITATLEDIKKQFPDAETIKVAIYTLTSFFVGQENISKVYNFLQALSSKCRKYNVSIMSALQPGPLGKQTVETIKGQVLGAINLKKTVDKSYLKVEGLIEAASNSSIEYELEPRDVKIKGAFQTESIR